MPFLRFEQNTRTRKSFDVNQRVIFLDKELRIEFRYLKQKNELYELSDKQ